MIEPLPTPETYPAVLATLKARISEARIHTSGRGNRPSRQDTWRRQTGCRAATLSLAFVLAIASVHVVRAQGGLAPQWTPPPHAAPAGATFYDPVLAIVASAAKMPNPFYLLFPLMLIGPVLPAFVAPVFFLPRKPSIGGRIALGVLGYGLGVGVGVVNLSCGTAIADALVYRFGAAGSAIVTGKYQTADVYNNQDVQGYNVLIGTADGKVVETGFETDDFNVYPSRNATTYPDVGDVFTVRYLPNAPKTFVIVADDDSPWAQRLRCDALSQAVSDAANKMNFVPDNASYRDAYARAVGAARQAHCAAD